MSLAEAIRPIEAAKDKVQLTFFNGSADAWHMALVTKGSAKIREYAENMEVSDVSGTFGNGNIRDQLPKTK